MASVCALLAFLAVCLVCVNGWSGNVCSRAKCGYRYKRVCRYRWWGRCCSWKTIREAFWYTQYFCCPGWRHNGNRNCNIPICSPPCQNGGSCVWPGRCDCPDTHKGYRCSTAVCSYQRPCYPGTCYSGDSCTCSPGFQTASPVNKQNYCLNLVDDRNVDLQLTEMQVRMSYWPPYANPPMELHYLMADSTNQTQMDVIWTNRRLFNRIETTCSSQYLPPDLTDRPPYVETSEFGVVQGEIELWLMKILPGGIYNNTFTSLNKTFDCQQNVGSTQPEANVFNCSISDPTFDRSVDHRDTFKVTFKSKGGGYRRLKNTDTKQTHLVQSYTPVGRELAVEFRFDLLLPSHCGETKSCLQNENMLQVPELTQTNPITIGWNGWVDEDSGMFRYAWEVHRMTKTLDGGLEIKPSLALQPLVNTEVFESSYAEQSYRLPEPGVYSVILEAGDEANNTKFVRRLVFYDPSSSITTDPVNPLHVATASAAANFSYQNDITGSIEVTWDSYFRNAFHEDNNLLGAVRRYPPELRDGKTQQNKPFYRKEIPKDTEQDDHEGRITVDGIANTRGIVKFYVQHERDHDGGLKQPQTPSGSWIPMYLNTSFRVPESPSEADTVTVWVKAKDVMGIELVQRTQVTFDSTPPQVGDLAFRMNTPVPGIAFSSQFHLPAKDDQSGIAYIDWVFTRVSNNTVIYRERMPGNQIDSCQFGACGCVTTGQCYPFTQRYSISNCHMMVEKENLPTETINVTAHVTNMAGLVTTVSMLKDDLTKLNGTEAYFPPQNITATTVTQTSITITWSFPPTCFARTALWVIVNDQKRAVHKDATQFAVTNLDPGTAYTIYMVTDFVGQEQSAKAPFQFTTIEEDALSAGAIVGIILGFLILIALVVFIVIFCLWKRGVLFQKEGTAVNKNLHRVSRALTTVRRTVYGGVFDNPAYKTGGDDDDLYMYGAMTFSTRQPWQISDSDLTLLDHVGEGKFATIYKATWTHSGKQETVVAKMLKPGFTEDDAMKMMAKINFMATQLDRHDNVLAFLGAVTDNQGWGPVLVSEYCEIGQLDKWLIQRRGQVTEQVIENLFQFSLGIAKGMEHLVHKKILHRRLAARNILLNFLLQPKVAGFGPHEKEGSQEKTTRVPAKWAAPEVLQDRPPTEKSDVWSYGVVLWELFSMGETPYPGIPSAEIGTRLKNGYRMGKPELAEDLYADLMQQCWEYKANKRPSFSTIRQRLDQQFTSSNRKSCDFYYDTKQLKI